MQELACFGDMFDLLITDSQWDWRSFASLGGICPGLDLSQRVC